MTRSIRDARMAYKDSKVPKEFTRDAEGALICGARRSNTQGKLRCQSRAVMANGRCRIHGGASPSGPLASNYRDGRYDKSMPADLIGRFEEAMADRELLSLRQDVALLDAMITKKLAQIRDDEQNPDLNRISEMVQTMADEMMAWDWTRTKAELARLKDAIDRGVERDNAIREIRNLIDQKADIATREHRRLLDLDQFMRVEEGIALVRLLVGSIRRNVLPLPGGDAAVKAITVDYRNAMSVREPD